MDTLCSYLERKQREMALLDSCLRAPIHPIRPESVVAAIEQKFRLAALLKADTLLQRWSITETARPPAQWTNAGCFKFGFGYQRADLEVRGPPLYPALQAMCGSRASTVYTGSGMGAIAALLSALLQLHDSLDVLAPNDCYAETRELMNSLGSRIRVLPLTRNPCTANDRAARILWVDSSVRRSFSAWPAAMARDFDLVVFDTTCFWRSSARIDRAVQQALRRGIPIALVRSHGKLDTLGIEYGRLGSVVLVTPMADSWAAPRWLRALIPKIQDVVRLLGAAPILAHFPPFESSDDYRPCSAMRTASIMRNTRRLAQMLRSRLPTRTSTIFQHGLYVTIAVDGNASVDDVKQAAGEMAAQLAAHGLPVEHAGSFGFDFVAIEWSPDPISRINSMRIAGADLPLDLTDEIGSRIAAWWLRHLGRKAVDPQVLKRKAAA